MRPEMQFSIQVKRKRVALLLTLFVGTAIGVIGCGRKSQVLDILFEGNWDSVEIKNCRQFERKSELHTHEFVLLCGRVSGETLFALEGHEAEYQEHKTNGPNPNPDFWRKIREKGQDAFLYEHARKYTVFFTGAAKPVNLKDEEPLIYWTCRKSDRGLICDP
jgi:hypothetical protein